MIAMGALDRFETKRVQMGGLDTARLFSSEEPIKPVRNLDAQKRLVIVLSAEEFWRMPDAQQGIRRGWIEGTPRSHPTDPDRASRCVAAVSAATAQDASRAMTES